ncbi:MAG: bifunctional 2-C-methyl-D-erythritol 4-phosphate cytidylyltransferase/2-C-methyl-D-erythritol 2,4-cyclodiphosphate synthase [Sneathiellales bacterium]|nr:bifunctional 2-C-methyl-D-erythritol 4-phosphate cytidylyltransferase/2-C-methyl-D-erythritol 2,4-cyclodiphosphate synthase [Sneathiellales bacterium]
MTTIALIVAAGSGSRTGLDYPKQYFRMGEKTVLEHVIDAFLTHEAIDQILVLINPADTELYEKAVKDRDLLPWQAGGNTRQQSVLNGLKALTDLEPDYVLIHDAARPFVSTDLINRCLDALKNGKNAILPALPIVDTLKSVEGPSVTGTINREHVVAAQTPQCFSYPQILKAHLDFQDQDVTDDIALAELAGLNVDHILGDPLNIKITTENDIKNMSQKSLTDIRTGLGFDVHAFEAGRPLWLGGVQIPYELGLKGHSDADVALHALTDAILGAIGDGDIGTHFPPTDKKWKGASSDQFLAHAASLVQKRRGKISNVDLTIICEAPKISPYRDNIRSTIADILSIEENRVSIKGTTTEKLGFTGRQEGIAAQAIATVRLPE